MTAVAAGPGELTGRVVRPHDSDYAAAAAGWNLLFAHRPSAIVFAQETRDVVNAVAWARRRRVPVRVRSGRHCLEGWSSVDDGVVIDVSELKAVAIDTVAGTATIGAGLSQTEVVNGLGRAGYAVPTGTEGTVGVVGATLGGGFGLLTRSFGMASDNLLAAEIVVASGTDDALAIRADETSNTDLLWALRGAGNGNFGVVTALTYRIHPLPQAVAVTATWSGLGDLGPVFEAWQQTAPHTDDQLTSQLEIRRDEIMLMGVLTGSSAQYATELLSPVLGVGRPAVSTTLASWTEVYAGFQIAPTDERANWKFVSQFIYEPFPPQAVEVIGSFLSNAPTADCNYFTNAFGGAVRGSEPPGGSTFTHRDSLFYAEPGVGWGERGGAPAADDPLTPVCLSWLAEFSEALQPFVNGAYVNVPNPTMPDWATAYWGSNVDRLTAVKAAYDPENCFNYEQSVPAATS